MLGYKIYVNGSDVTVVSTTAELDKIETSPHELAQISVVLFGSADGVDRNSFKKVVVAADPTAESIKSALQKLALNGQETEGDMA
jgi:hypothetical protein